ncbi:hypothetical protein MIDIC_30002 [Alphaproteobacteria bacterium]
MGALRCRVSGVFGIAQVNTEIKYYETCSSYWDWFDYSIRPWCRCLVE